MGDSFFTELRRRNVLRVAFVYLVAAWLILQVADLIVPILNLPEWSSKLIFLLLILGFPISLILAWAFEMTPEGLKKEKDVDRSQSITSQTGRRIDFVIIGSLVLALVYSIYFKDPDAADSAVPVPAQDGTHSIAVLPLVNMSSDPETDYFSDGLAEELLNLLAKVDSLRVAARTSSFAYKGSDQNIQKIGEELGVGHILEGSVRRAGNRVRITTQLINVADGFHLWSETYDRELTDIFALQDEIAAAVVKALRIELLDEEIAPERVAIDPAAYDLFLRARGELNENDAGALERAADYLQRAIEREPGYVAAMALLGSTYLDMDEYGSLSITESLRLSGPLIEKALELDPNDADAWAAQGYRQLRLDQTALAGDLLAKVGIQIGNAIEQRYYVLDAQQLRAAYYALAGERIRALYTLQQAADNGYSVPHDLETPFFDKLKNNPDFQAILEQVRANQAVMKAKVLALGELLPDTDAA
ncbi:MAG: hypothetical protein IIB68_03930 [Proteobacteria bacterium]|nr:hypothetical protein [Pseudomonadota bacterium]